ncbi:hypothetical protein BD779DRAFT_1666654 [Infundibulicybe gibba]|nr:hypothetical protein BD779DRAFT_1666654 [Infundibulicybe gibba]
MAFPADFTILDITGTYYMNKSLSGDTDEILALQGVGWFKRKVISTATVTLHAKHYKDDAGIEHIDIDQTITGGIPGTTEKRTLTWVERENEDHLFGAVKGRTRRIKVEELDEPYLKEGWTEDTIKYGVVQSYVESDTPKSGTTWIANQAWGMAMINGERRHVRRVKFTGPKGEDREVPIVYDYAGPL